MSVGLEVDPDGELNSSVVQVFDPGWGERDGHTQLVGDVRRAAAIGVGCLHKPWADLE